MRAAGPESLRVALVVVFVLGLGGWGEGCWEHEKLALLQLKPSFDVQIDPSTLTSHSALYDWVGESSDCCQWERVECDPTNGRVIGLSLTNSYIADAEWSDVTNFDLNQYFNASLFLPFEELKSLYLSGSFLAGCIHNEGFEKLALKLKKLEVFDLSFNKFNDSSILSSLLEITSLKFLNLANNKLSAPLLTRGLSTKSNGVVEILHLSFNNFNDSSTLSYFLEISSLKFLNLVHNEFNGPFDTSGNQPNGVRMKLSGAIEILDLHANELEDNILESLSELSYLEHLDLSSNRINGSIHNNELKNLKNLKGLDLSYNQIQNLDFLNGLFQLKNLESLKMDGIFLQENFFEKIGTITSLKILSLCDCGLNGTLRTQDICQLRRLEELDISTNMLRGALPDCFSNLTFLTHLDLSSNQFHGSLSAISRLQSLAYIDLSNNQFQIPSSLKPFFNHSKLKHFNGGNNNITYAETELHSLTPRFQLNYLSLSCCGDVGPLPKFLYHQHELQFIDLSNINLTGEFPSWLLENNTELDTLFLINNSLSGNFRLPFHSHMKLVGLDVSSNFFNGHIPIEIGLYLPGLEVLNISNNCLDGSIPSSIGDMKSLNTLDLSNNRLSGTVPENLSTGCFSLESLVLSNNTLQGRIFPTNFNLTNLRELYMGENNFTGSIPNSLSNCSSLYVIDIGYNHISGGIPRWMWNMSQLEEIMLPNNHIEGLIPREFCQLGSMIVLDLTMNNLSGTLPACFNNQLYIKHVHLSNNRLQGSIPNEIFKSSQLMTLDLSYNKLTGNIPNLVDNRSVLAFLVLKHNNLDGEIPNQFCQLSELSLIDLSHNNLSGHIPNCLNVTVHEEVPRGFGICYSDTHYFRCFDLFDTNQPLELTTKSISYSYKGRILRYLSGIDLSSNKLTGEIPHEMGNLYKIVMLNLSHNILTGSIPPSFSNLKQIESLDLSYNNLSGSIPPQFIELNSLVFFNVSYNNLSGQPPPRKAQFSTEIDKDSYWGNPFLCGESLPKNCSTMSNQPVEDGEDDEDDGLIDFQSFYVTFTVSYIMVLLCIATVMYINPHWRRAWFYLVERSMTSCFYFVIDNLPTRFCCGKI